jgi:hypothetical protein
MLATEKNSDVIEQVKKLIERISKINQTKADFFSYILKTQ